MYFDLDVVGWGFFTGLAEAKPPCLKAQEWNDKPWKWNTIKRAKYVLEKAKFCVAASEYYNKWT